MAEHGPLVSKYLEAIRPAFESRDPSAFAALWAEDCHVHVEGTDYIGRTKWIGVVTWALENLDWLGQDVEASHEADGVVALFGRNRYGDGSSLPIAGILRFNDHGQIVSGSSIGGMPTR